MRYLLTCFILGLLVIFVGCDSRDDAVVVKEPTPWTHDRVEGLRMPGVVDEPGKIYRKAYERAMSNITPENLLERLEALEREIEVERGELP